MADEQTVLLGQFTDENAERIAQRLETAGITWWFKRTSGLSRFLFAGEWGVRIFVAADRRDEAVEIARGVTDP